MNQTEYQKQGSRTIATIGQEEEQLGRIAHGLTHIQKTDNRRVCFDIVKPEPSQKLRLLHTLLGLMDELSEINMAVNKGDVTNLHEELGDSFWYLAYGCTAIKVDMGLLAKKEAKENYMQYDQHELVECLMHNIGDLASALKKTIFYDNEQPIIAIFVEIYQNLNALCETYGFSLSNVFEQNIQKLKIRFPKKFTEKDAVERKDKEDGE